MGTQISMKLSAKMYKAAKLHADVKGYGSIQDFIRELMREKLFEDRKTDLVYRKKP